MKRAALFFDIDGTLTNYKTHEIIQDGIEAIREARAEGHLAFINTGRVRYILQPEIEALPMDGFILGCGTGFLYKDGRFRHTPVSDELCIETTKRLFDCNIAGLLEGSNGLWYVNCDRIPLAKLYADKYYANFHFHEFSDDIHKIVLYDKFCVITGEHSEEDTFFSWAKEYYDIIPRFPNFYELVPLPYSKATGIQEIQREFDIDLDHVYIFGDSTNDLPMFQYATHTICMGGHDEELEEYTEYMAPLVQENGIRRALEHYGLIPKK